MAVDHNTMEIQGLGKKVKLIIDDNSPMIMSICYTMRILLFGEKDFEVTQEVRDTADKGNFIPENSCELVDRFLTLCLKKHWPLGVLEQVKAHVKMLSECRDRFVLTPDLAVSPLIRQVLQCVALSSVTKVLILEHVNIELCSAMLLDDLLNVNTSISELEFSSVNLSKTDCHLTIFGEDLTAPIVSVRFVSCEMDTPGITCWLEDLGGYRKRHIESLAFEQCQVDTTHVIKQILRSPTLHNLNKLVITESKIDQDLFEQLYLSDWLLRSKSLRQVKFDNNGIVVGSFLPLLFRFDGGLEKLVCTQNDFSKPLVSPITTFFGLRKLDLSSSRVTAESLMSLFDSLTKSGAQPSAVILNNLSMTFDDASLFYSTIDKYVMNELEVFSWTGNKVPKDRETNFFTFLQKQPKLHDLTISHVLHSATPKMVPLLCSALKSMKLQRLVIRGKLGTTFGQEFNDVLNVFLQCEDLFGIDIIGHKIGDAGLRIILDLLQNDRLAAIAFDGTCASDLDLFCSVLEAIVKSREVSYAAWPEIDIKCLISKVPSAQRPVTFRRIEELKRGFVLKFGQGGHVPGARNMASASRSLRGSALSLVPHKTERVQKYQDPRAIDAVLSVKDIEISKLMIECMDFSVLNPENDVLVRAFNAIQNEIRFEY